MRKYCTVYIIIQGIHACPCTVFRCTVKYRESSRWHDDVSLNDVSPNEKSRMLRPLENASLGRCVTWTMRPLDDDASLGRCVPYRCVPTIDQISVKTPNSKCRLYW